MPAKGTSPRERWNPLLKSYPDSERVNAVSISAETMFTRLIAKADDYGNYWAHPRELLGGLYRKRWKKQQVTENDMVRWRNELDTCMEGLLIAFYSVNGEDYLHVLNPRRRLRGDTTPEELVPREPSDIEEKALSEHVARTYRRRTNNVPLDPDLDQDLEKNTFSETDSIIDYLNQQTNSDFKHSKSSRENIHARLADGLTADDCKLIIDYKCREWLGDTEWEGNLTPVTLFRPTKYENNLNAAKRWEAKGRPSKDGSGLKEGMNHGADYYEKAKRREEIIAAFSVPSILVGDHVQYSKEEMYAARDQYYKQKIMPLIDEYVRRRRAERIARKETEQWR